MFRKLLFGAAVAVALVAPAAQARATWSAVVFHNACGVVYDEVVRNCEGGYMIEAGRIYPIHIILDQRGWQVAGGIRFDNDESIVPRTDVIRHFYYRIRYTLQQ